MSPLAFDTHRAVKALCEAGAAEPLAEAFVETIGDAVSGNVATKADIDRVETTLRADIADVKADVDRVETTLKADIDRIETTLKAEIAESEARVQMKIAEVQAETKADIAGVRAEVAEVRTEVAGVRTEVANVRAELKTDLGGLEGRLYRQLWLMAVGIVGLTVALVKLLG